MKAAKTTILLLLVTFILLVFPLSYTRSLEKLVLNCLLDDNGVSIPITYSAFEEAVEATYSLIHDEEELLQKDHHQQEYYRNNLDVKQFTRTTNGGGLHDKDRLLLTEIYGDASSVFEFGLGESTYIANYRRVNRYAGIDSDVLWVDQLRRKVSPHFRFYYGDVGDIGAGGIPTDFTLAKINRQYQIVPLLAEPEPFDVYAVNGRWKIACLALSFLHASYRGADPNNTIVLLHDCYQEGYSPESFEFEDKYDQAHSYGDAFSLLQLWRHSGYLLCAFKRLPSTTDDDFLELWKNFRDETR